MAQTGLPADDVATTRAGVSATVARAPTWAWVVCWLMFASTVLNYMDRQTIALVGPQIRQEFHLRNVDFGWVLAAFSLTYALFQVPAGYLVDRWNVRWAYAGAVTWWSIAAMAAAYSPTLGALVAFRALLGVGESFNWPCALRVTRTVLPPSDRSLGNGIFNSGAAVGAVITPLVVVPIELSYGWRRTFLLIGSVGFVWVAVWVVFLGGTRLADLAGRRSPDSTPAGSTGLSRPWRKGRSAGCWPRRSRWAVSALWIGVYSVWLAIALLMTGILVLALVLPADALTGADWAESLGAVVRLRRFWVLMLVTVSINVCWHFLLNWLPTYIREDVKTPAWLQEWAATPLANALAIVFRKGVDPRTVGNTLLITLPFLAADVGNLLGGVLARFLAGRGCTPVQSRLAVMGLCTFVISSGAWVGRAGNANIAIYLLSLMAMGTAAFMANYFSFAQEVSAAHTGLIVGILGAFGNLFAAGFLPFAGAVKDATGGFAPIFVLVGLMPFVGLTALLLGWGRRPARPGTNLRACLEGVFLLFLVHVSESSRPKPGWTLQARRSGKIPASPVRGGLHARRTHAPAGNPWPGSDTSTLVLVGLCMQGGCAMNQRSLGVKLTLNFACLVGLTLAGCESLHHGLQPKDRDPEVAHASAESTESDEDKVLDVKSDSKTKVPFFKSSRLSGGLSPEARDIEKDMGIQ